MPTKPETRSSEEPNFPQRPNRYGFRETPGHFKDKNGDIVALKLPQNTALQFFDLLPSIVDNQLVHFLTHLGYNHAFYAPFHWDDPLEIVLDQDPGWHDTPMSNLQWILPLMLTRVQDHDLTLSSPDFLDYLSAVMKPNDLTPQNRIQLRAWATMMLMISPTNQAIINVCKNLLPNQQCVQSTVITWNTTLT